MSREEWRTWSGGHLLWWPRDAGGPDGRGSGCAFRSWRSDGGREGAPEYRRRGRAVGRPGETNKRREQEQGGGGQAGAPLRTGSLRQTAGSHWRCTSGSRQAALSSTRDEGWRPWPDGQRSPGSRVEVESVRLECPESAGLKPLRKAACCVGPMGGARPRSLLGFGTVFLPLVLKFLDEPLLQPVVALFPYFDGSHSPVKSSLQ